MQLLKKRVIEVERESDIAVRAGVVNRLGCTPGCATRRGNGLRFGSVWLAPRTSAIAIHIGLL